MTVRLVKGFKIIDVKSADGDRRSAVFGHFHRLLHSVVQEVKVRESGQSVVVDKSVQLLTILLLSCDVAENSQIVLNPSGMIGDGEDGRSAVVLDANLQVVASIEAVAAGDGPISDIAVHGDQVIILTGNNHPRGSGLRLLDLDGQFLRSIVAAQFRNPWALTASHGRAFVVDDDDKIGPGIDDDDSDDDWEPGKVLHVIDIQSGDILQSARFELGGEPSAILVDGDEIYIAGFDAEKAVVLRFAGSEA